MDEAIQAEVAAMRQSYEADIANLTAGFAREKAGLAAQCAALALALKNAEAKIPKPRTKKVAA